MTSRKYFTGEKNPAGFITEDPNDPIVYTSKRPGPKPKHGEPTILKSWRVPESLNDKIQAKADRNSLPWAEWLVKHLKSTV